MSTEYVVHRAGSESDIPQLCALCGVELGEGKRSLFSDGQWVMERRDITVDPPRVTERVAVEVLDQPVGIPLCTGTGAFVPGAGVRVASEDDDLSQLVDEGGPSRPFRVATAFLALAGGWLSELGPDFANAKIEDLVTADSVSKWNLDEVAETLSGYGVSSRTRYMSPMWAKILLMPADEPLVIDKPSVVENVVALYVRYQPNLADWRVHMLAAPDIDVKDLP